MKLIPFDKFQIITTKKREQIMLDLAAETNEGKLFSPFKEGRGFFNGHLEHSDIKITKDVIGRNSFLPIITGKVYDTGEFRRVDFRARLAYFPMFLMTIWIGASTAATLIRLFMVLFQGAKIDTMFAYVALFALLGYAITMLGFFIPLNACKKKLNEIIEE